MIEWVPVPITVGVYVTLQLAELEVGLPKVQGDPVKVPVPLLVNETVPVGALALPPEMSVTVAVHVVPTLTATDEGEQLTLVEVARFVTEREKGPEPAA